MICVIVLYGGRERERDLETVSTTCREFELTMPIRVNKMITANVKKATKAFAWTLGCRF